MVAVKVQAAVSPLLFQRPRPTVASPSVADPVDAFRATAAAPDFSPSDRGVFDGISRLGKKLAAAGRTAAQVAPSLGILVASWQASRIEGWLPGGRKLSAIDWLRYRMPDQWARTAGDLVALGGPAIHDAVGLGLHELMVIDEHLYKMLAPTRNAQGVKEAPEFIKRLAEDTFADPNAPHSAYVYLGEGKQAQSEEIMDLWRGSLPPHPNPYQPGDDRFLVWQSLAQKTQTGKMPVFIDMDDDVTSMSNAEYLAKETVSSLVERSNNLGGNYTEASLYYSWLVTRLGSYYRVLDPWIKQQKPEVHEKVEQIKENLTPSWLGGQGIGPFSSAPHADEAMDIMKGLLRSPKTDFADAAIALDRDILTGVQTHWIKLLREGGGKGRKHILTTTARNWVHLNLKSSADELSPANAPILRSLEGPPPRTTMRRYDRSIAFGEVVDHTLRGLGIAERKQMMTEIKVAIQNSRPELDGREMELRSALGNHYAGVDFENLQTSVAGIQDLRAIWDGTSQTQVSPEVMGQVGRHLDLLHWMTTADQRYGDVDPGVEMASGDFKDDPFSVCEYFWQDRPQNVTGLKPGPSQVDWLGKGPDTNGKLVSVVLEGGGGKGFAYMEALRQLRASMENSNGRFGIDEFVGTSAGALTAGILAAGYTTDEVGDILSQLDFKKFNSDAIWMMGGVDPKVRGINRTALFSQQKMYQTFYDLISKKLGIEGRPVLFRDLPFKLKVTTNALNTDIPKDDPLYKLIDGDGRMVLSSDTTPNFDVVGAIIASSAVPAFFAAPQMEVARSVETEPGVFDVKRWRIQFCDGGVTDNLPVSSATLGTKSALTVLPVKFSSIDPATGKRVSLETLNFDTTVLPLIDAENQRNFQRFSSQMGEFFTNADADRLVVALNLTGDQDDPGVMGRTREQTSELVALAAAAGMPQTDAAPLLPSPPGFKLNLALGGAFKAFLDGQKGTDGQRLEWSYSGSRIRMGVTEEEDIIDIARGAGAAGLATERVTHGFEIVNT